MPGRIVAIAPTIREGTETESIEVVGASYFDPTSGFLSALAVLPSHRGQGIGKILIAATLRDMLSKNPRLSEYHLHMMECDATPETNGLYVCCSFQFEGPEWKQGGNYRMSIGRDFDVDRWELSCFGE
jgi:GNAT superfamily N-acetyltransferase